MGHKAEIWASKLIFGPQGWDSGLKAEIWPQGWDLASRLGFGPQGGGRAGTKEEKEEKEEKEKFLHM